MPEVCNRAYRHIEKTRFQLKNLPTGRQAAGMTDTLNLYTELFGYS